MGATVGVAVGGRGVMVGEGEGVAVGGPGVNVGVAGGATLRTSFCSGRMTDAAFSPFQAIRSAREISYQLAIQERVSPL